MSRVHLALVAATFELEIIYVYSNFLRSSFLSRLFLSSAIKFRKVCQLPNTLPGSFRDPSRLSVISDVVVFFLICKFYDDALFTHSR